jgi:hypothetical protein
MGFLQFGLALDRSEFSSGSKTGAARQAVTVSIHSGAAAELHFSFARGLTYRLDDSTSLDGKRALLTQPMDFMAAALVEVFERLGAELIADARPPAGR